MQRTSGDQPSATALSSLLDRIDSDAHASKIRKLSALDKQAASSASCITATESEQKPSSSSSAAPVTRDSAQIWREYVDPATKKSYYHNLTTNETSWDKPASFIPAISNESVSASFPSSASIAAASAAEYGTVGYFNSQNGRFTAGKSHLFDQMGRPIDRSVRQLSAFVDLQDLERNREETKQKRAEVAESLRGTDWKAVNKQKKEERKRKRLQWMLED